MADAQLVGVQRLAGQRELGLLFRGQGLIADELQKEIFREPVDFVAHDRQAGRLEVHSNLMQAPGEGAHLEPGAFRSAGQDAHRRSRRKAVGAHTCSMADWTVSAVSENGPYVVCELDGRVNGMQKVVTLQTGKYVSAVSQAAR